MEANRFIKATSGNISALKLRLWPMITFRDVCLVQLAQFSFILAVGKDEELQNWGRQWFLVSILVLEVLLI